MNKEISEGKSFEDALKAGRAVFDKEIESSAGSIGKLIESASVDFRDRQLMLAEIGRGDPEFDRLMLEGFSGSKYGRRFSTGLPGVEFAGNRGLESKISPIVEQQRYPLGFTSKDEFNSFKLDVKREIDNLPFSYDDSQVKIIGSSITGESSSFSKKLGVVFKKDKYHDYDINIVVNQKQFDEIAKMVDDALVKLDLERPNSRWGRDLKYLRKNFVPGGRLNAFHLKQISADTKFEINLYRLGEKYEVKKIQVSVVKEGTSFDSNAYINFKFIFILIKMNYFIIVLFQSIYSLQSSSKTI